MDESPLTLSRCTECGVVIDDETDCVESLRTGALTHIDCVQWDDVDEPERGPNE